MIDGIKFLYEIIMKNKENKTDLKSLNRYIVSESRRNIDLIDIILRIKDSAIIFEVLSQLETESCRIFDECGFSYEQVFCEAKTEKADFVGDDKNFTKKSVLPGFVWVKFSTKTEAHQKEWAFFPC